MPPVPEPLVSVVVPTRSRPERLARLLDGLAAQTLEPAAFEVVVVSDGSSPATERATSGRNTTVVRLKPPRGPAGARNAGWQAARARYVAFIDDDCVPTAAWLERLLEVAHEDRVVQGRTLPDPAEAHRAGLFSRTVWVETLGPQYETCNILYPRSLLERLHGFEESFGFTPGGEDTDLAWRAIGSGYRTEFAPAALVHHAVEWLGPLGMLRVAARWSTSIQLFARHPRTRSMLYRGRFWNVWHYLMWRSILAVALPGWLRRMLLTLHLLALRRRALEAGSGSWAVAFLLVHDLVECWAVARGALRYRTLVL